MMSGALGAASPSPCRNNNYDFTLRYERIKLLERVLFQFDTNMKRTSQAMRDLATCFSHIGDSYEEVALCVSYATGGSAATLGTLSQHKNKAGKVSTAGNVRPAASAFQDQEGLKAAAKMFCTEARRMRDGECYVQFNEGVHKEVLGRLNEVHTQARKAIQIGERADDALKKLNKARTIVDKKVAKYERLGRPLTESKRYLKQKKTMDDAEALFESKAALFDDAYHSLMQTKLSITGSCIDSFLDLNLTYLCHFMQILGCLAPNGPRIVDDMIEGGRRLGQRIGVPEENLLASATHASRVGPNGRSRSAHNFTSFYRNRKGGAVEEDEGQSLATTNNRARAEPPAAAARAKEQAERRARSPSVRVPAEPAAAAPARAVPCQPRPAAAAGAAPTHSEATMADAAHRAGSHAPFGDTPKVQYTTRQVQQAGAQTGAISATPTAKPHTRPVPSSSSAAPAAAATMTGPTASNTPAAAANPTREPSHEPFASSITASRRVGPAPAPVERNLFNATATTTTAPAAATPAAAGARLRADSRPAEVEEAEEVAMRPTTATTVFDFPSIPSVSTATPANSQWATRMSRGQTTRNAAGPSAPPADEDDEDTNSTSGRPSAAGAQRRSTNAAPPVASSGAQLRPVNAFLPSAGAAPASASFTWPEDAEADSTGRPTVSASSLLAARAKVSTQPLPHWQRAGVRPSVTSIPELPSKASLSASSHSARSEGAPALTPAGVSTGTATPVPAFDWDEQSGHAAANGDGLVFISWETPKAS